MSRQLRELREKLKSYLDTAENILNKAANRDLTADEKRDFDGLMKKAEAIKETVDAANEIRDQREKLLETYEPVQMETGGSSRPLVINGQKAFRPSEKLAEHGHDGPGLGSFIKGVVTGNWDSAELKTLAEGVGSAGGFLVPTALSQSVIDLARAQTACVQAGAITLPMEAGDVSMGRLASDPMPAWRAENAAIAKTDPSFGAVKLTAKSLGCITRVSLELLQDAANIDSLVQNAIAAAMALELDRACLFGSGIGAEPLGLVNWTGINSTAVGGAFANYDKFLDALYQIASKNGPTAAGSVSMIANPTVFTALSKLKTGIAGDNTPLVPPADYQSLRKLQTTKAPTDTVVLGVFSDMIIGMRQQIQIDVSREAADSDGSAFSEGQIWIRALLRADVMLQHPGFFTKLTGIA